MCLLSIGLDTLGLLLRIWLWISVPMAVIILLVGIYFNYLRHYRPRFGFRLAIAGWGGGGVPSTGAEEHSFEETSMAREEQSFAESDAAREEHSLAESAAAEAESSFPESSAPRSGENEELGATGRDTVYLGLLWMKEKYEEYRKQADQRYDLLREELGRSQQQYRDLILVMEQEKIRAFQKATKTGAFAEPGASTAAESERVTVDARANEMADTRGNEMADTRGNEMADTRGNEMADTRANEMADARAKLVIDELKAQLLAERLKVEELVAILHANTQMIRKVIPDLGK